MTDKDRYGHVVDKRFRRKMLRITQGGPEGVAAACDYIEMRDREADPNLAATFEQAWRLAQRQMQLLLIDHDPSIGALEEQGRSSYPGMRLIAAFHEAIESGEDFSDTFASHRARWLIGAVTAEDEVAHCAASLESMNADIVRELSERQRVRYLGLPRTTPVLEWSRGDILNEPIQVNDQL